MARVVDLIEKNMSVIKQFVKIGRVPLSLMTDYDIYLMYTSIDYETRPMKKYEIVSKRFKVSVTTVRTAVREMQKNVN
jgi:hypothetical protein